MARDVTAAVLASQIEDPATLFRFTSAELLQVREAVDAEIKFREKYKGYYDVINGHPASPLWTISVVSIIRMKILAHLSLNLMSIIPRRTAVIHSS